MLQNRVDPFGNIIYTAARGRFMGNRGVLHNSNQEIIVPFKLKAWLTCSLEFRGRKRQVMAPNRYTELFFLDEATAFAAGHRPCFECRRKDANRFKSFWLQGNPSYHFDEKTSFQKIDAILHGERISREKAKITFEDKVAHLVNGIFVKVERQAYLFYEGRLYLWSPFGYETIGIVPGTKSLTVLTPKSILHAFRAGYVPEMALPFSVLHK